MLQEIKRVDTLEQLKDHNRKVGELSFKLAKFINMKNKECNIIYAAALNHDVGKLYIPHKILNKPGKLDKKEFEIMKKHPVYSYDYLKNNKELHEEICIIAKYHHENYDGTGYPEGLKGVEIPLGARIVRICDVFHALTSDRVYKGKLECNSALEIMLNEERYYDPEIFKAFIKLLKMEEGIMKKKLTDKEILKRLEETKVTIEIEGLNVSEEGEKIAKLYLENEITEKEAKRRILKSHGISEEENAI